MSEWTPGTIGTVEQERGGVRILVTLDADYADTAALRGPPSKVIWLRSGNQPTAYVEHLLRTESCRN